MQSKTPSVASGAFGSEFETTFGLHRPKLLRHCYRMLGSFADAEDLVQESLLRAWRARNTYNADAPLINWLMRIATNACLSHLRQKGPRHLPQLDSAAAEPRDAYVSLEVAHWVTPAPDDAVFVGPEDALESRETVALAFVALLQRLPPWQRAVLILTDVMGWSAAEIATTLGHTLPSVTSALHRARDTMSKAPKEPLHQAEPEAVREYLRCWEERDLDGLLARMHADICFSMPPYATWFFGIGAVREFLKGEIFAPFWARGLAARPVHANGQPAAVWYVPIEGLWRPHSIQVVHFEGARAKHVINFIGEAYLAGFRLPTEVAREDVGLSPA